MIYNDIPSIGFPPWATPFSTPDWQCIIILVTALGLNEILSKNFATGLLLDDDDDDDAVDGSGSATFVHGFSSRNVWSLVGSTA